VIFADLNRDLSFYEMCIFLAMITTLLKLQILKEYHICFINSNGLFS